MEPTLLICVGARAALWLDGRKVAVLRGIPTERAILTDIPAIIAKLQELDAYDVLLNAMASRAGARLMRAPMLAIPLRLTRCGCGWLHIT